MLSAPRAAMAGWSLAMTTTSAPATTVSRSHSVGSSEVGSPSRRVASARSARRRAARASPNEPRRSVVGGFPLKARPSTATTGRGRFPRSRCCFTAFATYSISDLLSLRAARARSSVPGSVSDDAEDGGILRQARSRDRSRARQRETRVTFASGTHDLTKVEIELFGDERKLVREREGHVTLDVGEQFDSLCRLGGRHPNRRPQLTEQPGGGFGRTAVHAADDVRHRKLLDETAAGHAAIGTGGHQQAEPARGKHACQLARCPDRNRGAHHQEILVARTGPDGLDRSLDVCENWRARGIHRRRHGKDESAWCVRPS